MSLAEAFRLVSVTKRKSEVSYYKSWSGVCLVDRKCLVCFKTRGRVSQSFISQNRKIFVTLSFNVDIIEQTKRHFLLLSVQGFEDSCKEIDF